MALAQLIYVSRRTPALSLDTLNEIVTFSTQRNASRSVSGILLCCGKDLMQLLEGELEDIVTLYDRIRQDSRHTHVSCLYCKNVTRRLCPEWGMGLADLQSKAVLDRSRLSKLIDDIRLNVDTSHFAVEARVLLRDFKQQLHKAA